MERNDQQIWYLQPLEDVTPGNKPSTVKLPKAQGYKFHTKILPWLYQLTTDGK